MKVERKQIIEALNAASELLGKGTFQTTGEGSFQLSGAIRLIRTTLGQLQAEEAEADSEE